MEPTNNCCNGGIGYQKPNVECHLADIDDTDTSTLLRRLLSSASASANDNGRAITGLEVRFSYSDNDDDYEDDCGYGYTYKWYNKLGCAIGNSQQLRTLRIQDDSFETAHQSKMFLEHVAANRSIEHLSLNRIYCIGGDEIFRIFAPFIAHNHNLRSIEFDVRQWNTAGINDFISVLFQSKTIQLENISLISVRMGDESVADLCNAFKSMPGLCHLTNLNLEGNIIKREGCKALCGLLSNETTNLLCLTLSRNDFDDQCMDDLTCGLMKNHTIKVLDLSYLEYVTPDGWRAFAAYLTICSLDRLDVGGNRLGGEGAMSFGIALDINNAMKLKCLSLSGVKSVTTAGWRVLSSGLSSMEIEELHLCQANIDDDGAATMVSAIAKTKHLKSLHMGNRSVTSAGWIQCFLFLSDSDIRLKELHLRGNNIDDEAAAILAKLLVANNAALKSLDLSSSESISSAGWVRCFQLLRGSKSNLKSLALDHNEVDDEGARLLVDLLSENYSVSTLSLQGHSHAISTDGWLGFRRLLLPSSTSSMLKELNLGAVDHSPLTNALHVALFAHVMKDSSLEVLRLFDCFNYDDDDDDGEDYYSPTIPMQGWDKFAEALCDSSSIANVCTSNHSLYELWEFHWNSGEVIPSEIQSLLRMNRNKNKAEVVRRKLLNHFFSEASNVERTFANFTTTMMPDAMGWVGSDHLGFSTMYRLLGSMPWLLQSKPIPIATVTMEPPAKFRKVDSKCPGSLTS
jgi:Ran GTPase-activating protein (RanGAP) involved in mRNA processing and transport